MSSHVFKIEPGVFALKLVGSGDNTAWNTPAGKPLDQVLLADYTTVNGGDYSCQMTSGALTASPNTTDETTAATFCDAEVVTTTVGVTSYTIDCSFLQDPDLVAGLNKYLFVNDTLLAYCLLGLDGVNPPKIGAKVRLIAGTIGGDARVTLTATLSLPVEQKPDIVFGDATSSDLVEGSGTVVKATSMTAGIPGTVTPANATSPGSLAELTAAAPPVTASPTTAWTVGQYVQLPGTGTSTGGQVHWTSSAWVAGKA